MQNNQVVIVDVGGVAVALHTTVGMLVQVLEHRFRRFLNPSAEPVFHFDITVIPHGTFDGDADLKVHAEHGRWIMERGDFHAEWDVAEGRGRIWRLSSFFF